MSTVARRCSPLAPKFALNLSPRALGPLAARPADGEQVFQTKATSRLPSAGSGPSPILPNLYLGCYGDAQSRETLQRLGIRRILNLAAEECEDTVAQELNLQLLSIALRDHSDAPISEFFDQCFAFIEEGMRRQEPVLVHCRMGVSRSATIVIAYLMSHGGDSTNRNWTYEASFDYVKDRRPLVSPNLGFVLSLHHLEQKCTASARSMQTSTAAKCVACSC